MKDIRNLREENGITRSDFAKKVGVSLTTCQNWENEVNEPNEKHRKKINEIFGIVEK